MSLADICCMSTITSLQLLIPPQDKHAYIRNWLEQMKSQPFYEINVNGLKRLQGFIDLLK